MNRAFTKQDREPYQCRDIFMRNSFLENSVQYEVVEIHKKEDKPVEATSTFCPKGTPTTKRFEMGASSDRPILNFHFTLEGMPSYEPHAADEAPIHIPEGYCNMYYSPNLEGKEVFLNGKTKIFKIYVANEYLQHLLHPDFNESYVKLQGAIADSKPFKLWEKCRPTAPVLISKIHDIIHCSYTGQLRQRYLESKLTALLIDFLFGSHPSESLNREVNIPEADYSTLVSLEAYIRENLKKPLNILVLAEIAGFNTTKLKRDFKKVYGKTIFKYITGLRMEAAKKSMVENGISVTQAAYEAGYSNPQHFTVAFKKTMGYLPSVLRQATYLIYSFIMEVPNLPIGV